MSRDIALQTHTDTYIPGPYQDTTLQTHANTHIPGPSHITGPQQPPKMPEVIQSKKIPN